MSYCVTSVMDTPFLPAGEENVSMSVLHLFHVCNDPE